MVTGSARLSVYKKGSDSLTGRYFQFCLHPLTLGEMEASGFPSPNDALSALFQRS